MDKANIYTTHNLYKGKEIKSVGDFLQQIKEWEDSTENSGKNDTVVFRGQRTDFWRVEPSVFREEYLSVEHDLLQQPLMQIPKEFHSNMDLFEIMAKYQHYGMCTRLLDLTTNPLVALYFACEHHGNVKYSTDMKDDIEEREPYGVIYFKRVYPVAAIDKNVKIISALARLNLNQMNRVDEILEELYTQSVISEQDKTRWLSYEGYEDFVDILKSNYIVRPIYSNDRLVRQSGMFLLAGCFSVQGDSENTFVVEKERKDFKDFFDGFFYIDGENKYDFLQELDRCNINEATLFPELEHQLSYIKNKISNTS